MIILDTNVISELMKPIPCARVVDWLDNQLPDLFSITSVVLAELLNGIEMMQDGRRKQSFRSLLRDIVGDMIDSRVIAFDHEMARKFAIAYNIARSQGVSVGFADCQIAATAMVHGHAVATRDELPFKAMGVTVINPWTA